MIINKTPALLDFEKELAPIVGRIDQLQNDPDAGSVQEVSDEMMRLEKQQQSELRKLYRNLDSWNCCKVARHPDRPHTKDYIEEIFTDFTELHGDRMYADDKALIGGMARFDDVPVMVIGHQKGRGTEGRIACNWGMPHPEGYRKALRLLRIAERFKLPVISFIDTPGAFCGVGAEERGMSHAIGVNLAALATLQTRIIAVVIGEGGSGGALAIGVCDELLMFENSIYSVISPEGCASILWKSGNGTAEQAANALQMRARDLHKRDLVDKIIPEAIGGAHRNPDLAAKNLADALRSSLKNLFSQQLETCLAKRTKKLREYGVFSERRS